VPPTDHARKREVRRWQSLGGARNLAVEKAGQDDQQELLSAAARALADIPTMRKDLRDRGFTPKALLRRSHSQEFLDIRDIGTGQSLTLVPQPINGQQRRHQRHPRAFLD
jgi:hypothetical protein